jgi:lipid-binding SYLF domain-containing protein
MIRASFAWLLGTFAAIILSTGCTTAPKSAEGKADIEGEAASTVAKAQKADPGLAKLLSSSAGYAVFPTISKGAVGVGGAYGQGVLYENGKAIGYCDMRQASIGAQIGGQGYTEIVVFQTPTAVDKFKKSELEFSAQASAVALKSGSSENAKFTDGVAAFTLDESGLMAEAAVGGQRFTYQAK